MTSTASEPGAYDALEKARPDEPIFTLLGRDPVAPEAVLFWVDRRRALALALTDPERQRDELRQCTDAEMVACDMRRWRRGEPEHDTTTPARASYAGQSPDASRMDEAARKAAIAASVAQLREAAYFISEALAGLAGLHEVEPQEAEGLTMAVAIVNTVADGHTPRRPNYAPQAELALPSPASEDQQP